VVAAALAAATPAEAISEEEIQAVVVLAALAAMVAALAAVELGAIGKRMVWFRWDGS
jgi:adenine/guanine phosphoribosyltransferase-like PRPP-binding protein